MFNLVFSLRSSPVTLRCMQVSIKSQFEEEGRVWFRNSVSADDLSVLDQISSQHSKAGGRMAPDEGGVLSAFAEDSSIMDAIYKIDSKAKPVRAVSFNKSQNSNWGVPWHQDRVIAVAEKHKIKGFDNWTKNPVFGIVSLRKTY